MSGRIRVFIENSLKCFCFLDFAKIEMIFRCSSQGAKLLDYKPSDKVQIFQTVVFFSSLHNLVFFHFLVSNNLLRKNYIWKLEKVAFL